MTQSSSTRPMNTPNHMPNLSLKPPKVGCLELGQITKTSKVALGWIEFMDSTPTRQFHNWVLKPHPNLSFGSGPNCIYSNLWGLLCSNTLSLSHPLSLPFSFSQPTLQLEKKNRETRIHWKCFVQTRKCPKSTNIPSKEEEEGKDGIFSNLQLQQLASSSSKTSSFVNLLSFFSIASSSWKVAFPGPKSPIRWRRF